MDQSDTEQRGIMPRFTFGLALSGAFSWIDMLDGLQTENRTLHELVQYQEIRINVLKSKVKQLETERDILLSEKCEKAEDAPSGFSQK